MLSVSELKTSAEQIVQSPSEVSTEAQTEVFFTTVGSVTLGNKSLHLCFFYFGLFTLNSKFFSH